ncbi:MAG: pseudouridine synthase [Bacteroidota bacterium]
MNAMRKFSGEKSPGKGRKPDGAPDKRRAGKGKAAGKSPVKSPRSYKSNDSAEGALSGERLFKSRKSYGQNEGAEAPKSSFRGKRDEKPAGPWKRGETSGNPGERSFSVSKPSGDRPYKSRKASEGQEEGSVKPRAYKGRSDEKPARPWKRDEESGAARERRFSDNRDSGDRPNKGRKPFGEKETGQGLSRPYRGSSEDKPSRPWKRNEESDIPREKRYPGDMPSGDRPYKGRRPIEEKGEGTTRPYIGNREDKPSGPWKQDEDSTIAGGRRFSDSKSSGDRPYKGRKPIDEKGEGTDSPRPYRGSRADKPSGSWKRDEGSTNTRKSKFSERVASEPRTRIKPEGLENKPGRKFSEKDEPGRTGGNDRRKTSEHGKPKGNRGYADDGTIRLNKFIANSGISSRREADTLIESGAVSVNGRIVTELGTKISREDKVQIGGETLSIEKKVYLLLNKPKGYITTVDDPQERNTVMMLVKDACRERIYPVGRLDRNTSGLLLFTNDGEMAKKLTHPGHKVRKVYHVELNKPLSKGDMVQLSEGIELEDGFMAVDEIAYTGTANDKKNIGVVIHSGKNRVIRRLFEALEYEIVKLDRVAFANLTKKDLPRGRWRFLDEKELSLLQMI